MSKAIKNDRAEEALIKQANALADDLVRFLVAKYPRGDARVALTALNSATVKFLGQIKSREARDDMAIRWADQMFDLAKIPARASRLN